MSWLARSLVNTLIGEDDDDDDQDTNNSQSKITDPNPNASSTNQDREAEDDDDDDDDDEDLTRGVKEDLSELTQTLSRQFWGVASFLAPPPSSDEPPPPDPSASGDADTDVSPRLAGIRSDFSELGGRFKSGISLLSSAKAVTEISKIASSFLPFGSEEEDEEGEESEEVEVKYDGGVVGVSDEVIAFARNVSMHPETWLDFPLIPYEDDSEGLIL